MCADAQSDQGMTREDTCPVCRAVLTSDSDPIEVWLVTNNEPAPKPEAESADRLQLPLPPQQPAAPILHASAAPAPAPLLSTPSPQAQASPFFKADPDGEGEIPCNDLHRDMLSGMPLGVLAYGLPTL